MQKSVWTAKSSYKRISVYWHKICYKRDKSVIHKYGMRLRGFSIGCQPKEGFLYREDDESGTYYDILAYDRQLTWEEVEAYELNYIGREIE